MHCFREIVMTPEAPPPVLPLLKAIDKGELSVEAAFESYAERLAALEPTVKAFAHLDLETARRQRALGAKLPLRGLPVGIKDIFDSADMPTSYGSTLYAGHQPASDAAIIVMTRQAGGTFPGKTTTTAFAHLDPTPTENPAAPGHTPGGSSSGSAAAVSGGMVPFAFGTQTGGSVVRPASYCGVVGFKPSYRLIPTIGLKQFSWLLDTVGFFAPTVADAAYFLTAITGRPAPLEGGVPRFGLLEAPDWSLADKVMGEAVMTAARAAEKAGAKIINLPRNAILQAAWEAHVAIQQFEAKFALGFEYERHRDRLPPLLKGELEDAQKVSFEVYDEARGIAMNARREMSRIFDGVDALLMPAAPGAPPKTLGSTGRAVFNRLLTLTGDPAISVPGMKDPSGLPLGMQVIGPFGKDHQALAAAHFLEAAIARLD